MDTKTPTFEIPKSPEHESGGLPRLAQDVDPNLALEGTREILPSPVSLPAQPGRTPLPMPLAGAPSASPMPAPVHMPMSSDDSHLIADDVDVMEKEWVERAKKIVAATSNDPYVEAKELHKLKSAYMRKRFNKDLVPMDDGAAQ